MPAPFSYLLTTPMATVAGSATRPAPARPYAARGGQPHLGFGLVRPFRRDQKGDLVARDGVDLVRACVAQVLTTMGSSDTIQGEVPWRTEFGSLLHLLRHRNVDDPVTHEMAKVYTVQALRRWEPRVVVRSVTAYPITLDNGARALVIRLGYDVIGTNVAGNRVRLPEVDQEVVLQAAA